MPNNFSHDPILDRYDHENEPRYKRCCKCGQKINVDLPPWGNNWNCDNRGYVWHVECPEKTELSTEDEIIF